MFRTKSDNRCYIEAIAGNKGARFRFLMDTGANGLFFTTKHARQLGFDAGRLNFANLYSEEWGGKVGSAIVRLNEFRLGSFELHDVPAVIDKTGGAAASIGNAAVLGQPVLSFLHFQTMPGFCAVTLPGAEDVKPISPSRLTTHPRTALQP